MAVRVFGHYVSQPTRSVLWLAKLGGVDIDFTKVVGRHGSDPRT